MMSSLTVQDYHIGWICALNIELTAAMAMLDEEHELIAGMIRKTITVRCWVASTSIMW
jgi:hypothetical protein